MAYGMRVWDASGNLTMDSTDNMGRYLGQVATTGTTDGSASVPGWAAQGAQFIVVFPLHTMLSQYCPPLLTYSGDTISWTFESTIPAGNRGAVAIMFGVK